MNSDELEILNNKIIQEMSGIWCVYNKDILRVELHIKVAEITTKRLLEKCDVFFHLIVSKHQPRVVAIGLEIHDTDIPLLHTMIPEYQFEIDGINELLVKKEFNVIIYGEHDTPCANGVGNISCSNSVHIYDYDFKTIPVAPSSTLNLIKGIVDGGIQPKQFEPIFKHLSIKLNLNLKAILVLFKIDCLDGKLVKSDIGDKQLNEGDDLEHRIALIAESYNSDITYLSPWIQSNTAPNNKKEFCDLLINEPERPIIIQAKAVAFNVSGDRKKKIFEKRINHFLKEADAAISQLYGSIRKYTKSDFILVEQNLQNEIIKHQVVPIGVAIVTETTISDGNELLMNKIKSYYDNQIYIIVMSIEYFTQLTKAAISLKQPLSSLIYKQYIDSINSNTLIPHINHDKSK